MSLMRVALVRRKSRGTIRQRVAAELAKLDAIRADKERCPHRFCYSPAVRGAICLDCGTRRNS